ncbi:MAG: hypothetical protein J0L81_02160 [Caulobacterales bacterium]|jgi:hypothetical protein|nr:hypothetical protein [Caulobacterales bacterium]
MLETWLPWVMVIIMFVASAFAYAQTPPGAQFPMQWGLTGRVGWRAPRALAVLFSPLLAIAILALAGGVAPELAVGEAFPHRMLIAVVFLIVHAGHLFFALRDVEERRQ